MIKKQPPTKQTKPRRQPAAVPPSSRAPRGRGAGGEAKAGRVRAPEGFADPQGRKLLGQVTDETYAMLSTCAEGRCKICKLAATDPALLTYINKSCHTGVLYAEVVAECAARGFVTAPDNLSTHKHKHFEPMFRDHLMQMASTSTRAKMIEQATQDGKGLGSTILRELWVRVSPLLDGISFDKAPAGKISAAMRERINLVLQLGQTVSRAENADATTQLRYLDHQLKELRLVAGREREYKRILGRLRVEFEQYPEVWCVIQRVAEEARQEVLSLPAAPEAVDPAVDEAVDKAVPPSSRARVAGRGRGAGGEAP